jgi:hypothetical protein
MPVMAAVAAIRIQVSMRVGIFTVALIAFSFGVDLNEVAFMSHRYDLSRN